MSSSRRRGRSSGSPAAGRPDAAVDSAPETVATEAFGDAPPIEAVGDATETETAVIPEIPAEISPETVQAAVDESVAEATEQAADTIEAVGIEAAATVTEATETATEPMADAVEPVTEQPMEIVAAAPAEVAERTAETVDQVAETAMTLAAAPLAANDSAPEAAGPVDGTKSFAGAGAARFTFIPTFEPLNEINATLMAFARGEGEAAMAHLQALTKVKTPAEAIRLQVSEFQRAADASLTCFSHILRSANRFSGPTRWN